MLNIFGFPVQTVQDVKLHGAWSSLVFKLVKKFSAFT